MPAPSSDLKRYLPRNGMNWGTDRHILARVRRDRQVVRALVALRVNLRRREVQTCFTEMFAAATRYVERHQLPDDMSLGGFCVAFGRTNELARQLANPVVFGDLFESLIFGRARFVERSVETGIIGQPGLAPSPLVFAIDAFVAAAPCVDWDSNRMLVAANIDEDVTEVMWDEARGDWSVVVRPAANEEASFLALAEGLNVMGVEGGDEDEDEDEDDDVVMNINILTW